MPKTALVTDSTCDLPPEILSQYNVHILPLKIVYRDSAFADRVDIQPDEVYKSFSREIPRTSMPSPGEASQLLNNLKNKGFSNVLAIHMSSGLSGTFSMMEVVARQFSDLRVKVIDSKALSMGLGFLVYEAGRLISNGLAFDDVVARINSLKEKVNVFFVIKTLDYLRKGGRIGRVQATVGNILDIKPIISINSEGKYYGFLKVRGRKNSLNKIADLVREFTAGKKIRLAVMHGNALEEAKNLEDRLAKMPELKLDEFFFGQISPAMVVHTGPGLVGVAYHEI